LPGDGIGGSLTGYGVRGPFGPGTGGSGRVGSGLVLIAWQPFSEENGCDAGIVPMSNNDSLFH
jgi:hypothetical protein